MQSERENFRITKKGFPIFTDGEKFAEIVELLDYGDLKTSKKLGISRYRLYEFRESEVLEQSFKEKVCKTFRLPFTIWESNSVQKTFFEDTTSTIYNYEEASDFYRYYKSVIQNGRETIFFKFPSSIYKTSEDSELARLRKELKEQIENLPNFEIYSIESLLKFGFSEFGVFHTREEKIEILSRMLDSFGKGKELRFFNSFGSNREAISSFSDMLILRDTKRAVLPLPFGLDFIAEFKNEKILESFDVFLLQIRESGNCIEKSDSLDVLRILKSVLEEDGNFSSFLKEIQNVLGKKKAQLFLENVSSDRNF